MSIGFIAGEPLRSQASGHPALLRRYPRTGLESRQVPPKRMLWGIAPNGQSTACMGRGVHFA